MHIGVPPPPLPYPHPPPLDNDVIGPYQFLSAEGRVEHQKLNQTAALLSFG